MPKKLQTRPTSATQENQIVQASAVGHYGFRNISNQTPIATLEIQTVWAPIDFIHVLQCEFKGCGLKNVKSDLSNAQKIQTCPTNANLENQIVWASAVDG